MLMVLTSKLVIILFMFSIWLAAFGSMIGLGQLILCRRGVYCAYYLGWAQCIYILLIGSGLSVDSCSEFR